MLGLVWGNLTQALEFAASYEWPTGRYSATAHHISDVLGVKNERPLV